MGHDLRAIMLADQINEIKKILFTIDFEYLKECTKSFEEQASFEDAAAVLNPNWRATKSQVLYVQSTAMKKLYEFNGLLEKCQAAKDEDAKEKSAQEKISKLFW